MAEAVKGGEAGGGDASLPEGRLLLKSYIDMVAEFVGRPGVARHVGGRYYGSFETLLKDKGRWYEARPLPRGYRHMQRQHCYFNSAELSRRRRGLTYVEGMAWCGVIPTQHAWCADAEGRVVDVTWRQEDYDAPAAEWAYFGIPLPRELVALVAARSNGFSVLVDETNGCPLFKQEYSDEKALEIYRALPTRAERLRGARQSR